jgi:hypothetical protein
MMQNENQVTRLSKEALSEYLAWWPPPHIQDIRNIREMKPQFLITLI